MARSTQTKMTCTAFVEDCGGKRSSPDLAYLWMVLDEDGLTALRSDSRDPSTVSLSAYQLQSGRQYKVTVAVAYRG